MEKPSFHSRPDTQALIHSDMSGVTCKQTIPVQWFYLYCVLSNYIIVCVCSVMDGQFVFIPLGCYIVLYTLK